MEQVGTSSWYLKLVPQVSLLAHTTYYHHAVEKDSQTTPIRIVFDCSCRHSS